MPRATPILREKVIDEAGNIVELAIWRVPVGLRYRGGESGTGWRLSGVGSGARSCSTITITRKATIATSGASRSHTRSLMWTA